MEENNQKVAGATEKMTNQELVKEIKNKKEEIVMNDKKEVKETVVAGGEKAPIIPEDMIGDFEEEIDQEEMKKLEKENKKILDPIGAEVKEKIYEQRIKELEEEIFLLETDRNIWMQRANEELEEEGNLNYRIIEDLTKFPNCKYEANRTKLTRCELKDKETGNLVKEGGVIYIRMFLEEEILGIPSNIEEERNKFYNTELTDEEKELADKNWAKIQELNNKLDVPINITRKDILNCSFMKEENVAYISEIVEVMEVIYQKEVWRKEANQRDFEKIQKMLEENPEYSINMVKVDNEYCELREKETNREIMSAPVFMVRAELERMIKEKAETSITVEEQIDRLVKITEKYSKTDEE